MTVRSDGHVQRPMTPERKDLFLEALAATGSPTAAAEAATPWSKSSHGGLSSFKDERKRDPKFADDWQRAVEAAVGKIETEVTRRAFTPTRRPVYSKGELKEYVEEYDNRLLVTLARKMNPDQWIERRQIEHSGTVDHRHSHGHIVVSLEARDVLLLPEDERDQFMTMLRNIADAKEEQNRVIEHRPDGAD